MNKYIPYVVSIVSTFKKKMQYEISKVTCSALAACCVKYVNKCYAWHKLCATI